MKARRTPRPWQKAGFLLSGAALLLAACAKDAPQDSLDPAGPFAQQIDNLFKPVFWIAAAIFFLVEGLLIYVIVKYRRRPGREMGEQIHGNKQLEIGWTIAPALLLAGVAIPTVATLFSLDRAPEGNPVRVKVIAKQWWWDYEYPDIKVKIGKTEKPLRTANELHIPTGRPVFVEMESADVIHSFWVPRLAGKQDVVPGRVNHLKLQADEPGTYLGQCAEFCALSHANMRLTVVAQTPADFARWVAEQKREAERPEMGLAARGAEVFFGEGGCTSCHMIRGTDAVATMGPDLTHFMQRETFGGAMYENTPENLRKWLSDPQAAKPGNRMVLPKKLTGEEIDALIAFLQTLK